LAATILKIIHPDNKRENKTGENQPTPKKKEKRRVNIEIVSMPGIRRRTRKRFGREDSKEPAYSRTNLLAIFSTIFGAVWSLQFLRPESALLNLLSMISYYAVTVVLAHFFADGCYTLFMDVFVSGWKDYEQQTPEGLLKTAKLSKKTTRVCATCSTIAILIGLQLNILLLLAPLAFADSATSDKLYMETHTTQQILDLMRVIKLLATASIIAIGFIWGCVSVQTSSKSRWVAIKFKMKQRKAREALSAATERAVQTSEK